MLGEAIDGDVMSECDDEMVTVRFDVFYLASSSLQLTLHRAKRTG